jgi:hypothetical protein
LGKYVIFSDCGPDNPCSNCVQNCAISAGKKQTLNLLAR